MGSRVTSPNGPISTDENDENDESTANISDFNKDDESTAKLGDVLSGRLAAVDIDSVEAVRDTRER
ncbi:hypothetical protein [Halohasta litchfieldiae]|jgi:hypothetical protein|nr:hypothetical protein [Halohasta litchfieldiae]